MKLAIKKSIWIIMAFGWWGVLYPELSLIENTYRIVYMDEYEEECEENLSATELYYKLLSAEPERIKIKSKLFETVASYFQKGKDK